MKITFLRQSLASVALLVTSVLMTSPAPCVAASDDPTTVGTWDCLTSGGKYSGIAFITFSKDQSLHGYEMLVPTPPPSSNPRGGINVGRGTISNGGTNSVLLGFGPITGTWNYDSKHNLIGVFSEAVQKAQNVTNFLQDCSQSITVIYDVTNSDGSLAYTDSTNLSAGCFTTATLETNFQWSVINTNDQSTVNSYSTNVVFNNSQFTVTPGEPSNILNSVSFKGKVVGTRLTLAGTSSIGHIAYRGTPMGEVRDLAGDWYSLRTAGGQTMNEFFSLTSFGVSNPFAFAYPDISEFPNIYFTTNGVGAGYTVDLGIAIISSQNRIGFTFRETSTTVSSNSLRTTIGPVPHNGSTFKTRGTLDGLTPVRVDATQY